MLPEAEGRGVSLQMSCVHVGDGGVSQGRGRQLCRVAGEQVMALALLCSSRHCISRHAQSCSSSRGVDLQSLNSSVPGEPEARKRNPGDRTQEGSTHNH